MLSRSGLYQRSTSRRMLFVVMAILCSGASTQAKERKWISAELVSVKETQVETEDTLYRSSQPNNTMSAPPLASGAEKRTKKVYTYSFKTSENKYDGIAEKKPVVGLSEGMKVQIVIQRGWVIVQMPDGKEKKLDLVP
jgi:hypothetical protein